MKMKKLIKSTTALGLATVPFLLSAGSVLGTSMTFNMAPSGDFSTLSTFSLPTLISNLITIAMVLAGIIAFGMLIYGGILWISSGGDKGKTESARNTITAALIGLVIVFGSWAIMGLVNMIFGVDILSLNLNLNPVSS